MMKIEEINVTAYTVPTDFPESDGTLCWGQTTLVLVQARSGDTIGLGYTYADLATAKIVRDSLAPVVVGLDAMSIPKAWQKMRAILRNQGCQGAGAMAVSAVDNALWDLKARLCGLSLVELLGACRKSLPIYGSGGFTSYTDDQLRKQFEQWRDEGITRFKMKVGREPERDRHRVRVARETIGPEAELFVDANSAYGRKQALDAMECFSLECDVRWMEQPLPPADRAGMRWLRERGPASMEIADGEYGYDPAYFREMIEAEAVDVVMADATRCCGISGLLKIAALCEAAQLPLSTHCAPLLHLHPGCALPPLRHAEYFHDHIRIERLFFQGFPKVTDSALAPDLSAPGIGVSFNSEIAERFRQNF
jgi:L-alanine-DL-glutamate epimerase-like enolase superfamily enzyme